MILMLNIFIDRFKFWDIPNIIEFLLELFFFMIIELGFHYIYYFINIYHKWQLLSF